MTDRQDPAPASLVDAVMTKCMGVEILCDCLRCRTDAESVVRVVLSEMASQAGSATFDA